MTHWRAKQSDQEAVYGWAILLSSVGAVVLLVLLSYGKII